MPRALTNKQIAVLELLRTEGPMTAKRVGEVITQRTACPFCGGSGEGDDTHLGCRPCYGRGRVSFDYGTAYQCLQRLRKEHLVERSCMRDAFGDELPLHVYAATAPPDPDDPLERAFRAPSAEVNG